VTRLQVKVLKNIVLRLHLKPDKTMLLKAFVKKLLHWKEGNFHLRIQKT